MSYSVSVKVCESRCLTRSAEDAVWELKGNGVGVTMWGFGVAIWKLRCNSPSQGVAE